jgi:SAM-dependent methyltransferase
MLVRTEPQPDDLAMYYPAESYYSYAQVASPTAVARARVRSRYDAEDEASVFERFAGRIARNRLAPGLPPGPPGRILDVGCGSGQALFLLREAGWETFGIEIDASAVKAAHAAGLTGVRIGELPSAGYEQGTFDAVRFWHSLEHVRSPKLQLQEARRVLRPGGSLVIGVPNFSSALARAARDKWFYLDVPRHLWHFTPMTLTRLVKMCGFVDVKLRQVSTSTPLLGTLDYVRGGRERLLAKRMLWFSALPVAVTLDLLRLGDGLELVAHTPRN